MSIAQVVAGAYLSAYNGIGITGEGFARAGSTPGLGFMDDNGYEIEQQTHGEMVDRTDLYGQSLMDWVHQGGSVFMTFACMTFQRAVNAIKNVFYPWAQFGVLKDDARPIGRLASNVAQILLLSAVAGTPAATSGPLAITAYKAILPPGSNLRLMYATRVRKVPCRLALLPYAPSGPAFSSGAYPVSTVGWWQEL